MIIGSIIFLFISYLKRYKGRGKHGKYFVNDNSISSCLSYYKKYPVYDNMKVKIEQLCKSYGSFQVLDHLHVSLDEGVFGLIGNNGAGKSTLMKILATLLPFDKGEVSIFGYDLKKEQSEIRKLLGYLPQHFDFFLNITIHEAMNYFADLKGLGKGTVRDKEIESWLEQVGLIQHANKKVKQLSGGMKQRLGIAQALLGHPKLLIVDEPTVGLDPKERIAFRNLINRFSKGRTVILSTHIVPDVSSTCKNLLVLQKGRTLYQGNVVELLKKVERKVYMIDVKPHELEELTEQVQVLSIMRKAGEIEVRFLYEQRLSGWEKARQVSPNLEDAYIYLNSKNGL